MSGLPLLDLCWQRCWYVIAQRQLTVWTSTKSISGSNAAVSRKTVLTYASIAPNARRCTEQLHGATLQQQANAGVTLQQQATRLYSVKVSTADGWPSVSQHI